MDDDFWVPSAMTGQASPLAHVKIRQSRPRGLLAARERAMPRTAKGQKIKAAMTKQYGAEKGKQVFYASENKGTIRGVAKKGKSKKK